MKNNKGIITIPIVLFTVALIVVGGIVFYSKKNSKNIPQNTQTQTYEVPTGPFLDATTYIPPHPICKSDSTPWVEVLSPNGGEVFKQGEKITITWRSCKVIPPISLMLIKHDSANPYIQEENSGDYAGLSLGGFDGYIGTEDDGVQEVTLPTKGEDPNLISGQHYFIIVAGMDDPSVGPGFNPRDVSNRLFSIN